MADSVVFETNGCGLWTDRAAKIHITDMRLGYCNEEQNFGELRVYFDTKGWECEKHGLIYTDPLWIENLRTFLIDHKLCGQDIEYSEAGMQGHDYVSLDVGEKFLRSWSNKFGPIELDGWASH
jgi:hypothetical protein